MWNRNYSYNFIEERPVLWDRPVEAQKDKNVALEAWRQMCKTVHPNVESLDEREDVGKRSFVINFSCHKISMLLTCICGFLRLLPLDWFCRSLILTSRVHRLVNS